VPSSVWRTQSRRSQADIKQTHWAYAEGVGVVEDRIMYAIALFKRLSGTVGLSSVAMFGASCGLGHTHRSADIDHAAGIPVASTGRSAMLSSPSSDTANRYVQACVIMNHPNADHSPLERRMFMIESRLVALPGASRHAACPWT
jgi:hypothetical protein